MHANVTQETRLNGNKTRGCFYMPQKNLIHRHSGAGTLHANFNDILFIMHRKKKFQLFAQSSILFSDKQKEAKKYRKKKKIRE